MFALLFSLSASILIPVPRRHPGLAFGPLNSLVRIELFADPLCPY
jgi:hypothetical protein